jgi:hypothetical protein
MAMLKFSDDIDTSCTKYRTPIPAMLLRKVPQTG